MTAAAPDFLPRMIAEKGRHIIGGVPEGYRALVISDLQDFMAIAVSMSPAMPARWPACLGHLVFRARPADCGISGLGLSALRPLVTATHGKRHPHGDLGAPAGAGG